ncbi:ATP-binding protein [Streptomyces scopuliridis]|uniref:ATP-binding protein n=1 Tax=Streptomyces scopuliridis TaxID=452529 RepID=UPI0036CA4A75
MYGSPTRGPGSPQQTGGTSSNPHRGTDPPGIPSDGVGLGLTIAARFTEAMHGELTVEDTAGGGTTFVFDPRRAAS